VANYIVVFFWPEDDEPMDFSKKVSTGMSLSVVMTYVRDGPTHGKLKLKALLEFLTK